MSLYLRHPGLSFVFLPVLYISHCLLIFPEKDFSVAIGTRSDHHTQPQPGGGKELRGNFSPPRAAQSLWVAATLKCYPYVKG